MACSNIASLWRLINLLRKALPRRLKGFGEEGAPPGLVEYRFSEMGEICCWERREDCLLDKIGCCGGGLNKRVPVEVYAEESLLWPALKRRGSLFLKVEADPLGETRLVYALGLVFL